MSTAERSLDDILRALQERAKELNCLYRVDEVLNRKDVDWSSALRELVQIVPRGWQYPDRCVARLTLEGRVFEPPDFQETAWGQHADIVFEGETAGEISIYYTERMPNADEGPFLKEERRLINAIAERVGYLLLQRQLRRAMPVPDDAAEERGPAGRWGVILDFLRSTDRTLLRRISRRMINHLCWNDVKDAERLLLEFAPEAPPLEIEGFQDNRPRTRAHLRDLDTLADTTFELASRHLSEDEVFACIQSWIKEDKASFLSSALENLDTPLQAIADALERFHSLSVTEDELPMAVQIGLRVALMRRFFTDQLEFVNLAKDYVTLEDFHDLVRRVVFLPQSHGKLGGKSAGLFLASRIVARSPEYQNVLGGIKVPKTWYVTSDGLLQFLQYNDLEDVYDHKYLEIDRDPPRVPVPRPALQDLQLPAGADEGPGRGPRRFRGPADHRAQLEPARGPRGLGLLRQVQEPVPGQPGQQARAAGGAPGRHRRGVRLGLRPRPHRVPRGAGPARRARGDGHHDPGGRRPAARAATSCPPSPAWPSPTTSSAGRRGSSARTA